MNDSIEIVAAADTCAADTCAADTCATVTDTCAADTCAADTCATVTMTRPTLHTVELFWQALAKNEKEKPGLNQLQRYEAQHSPAYIKKFIEIGGGARMGTVLEQYARFHFSVLQKRGRGKNETGYDHLLTVTDLAAATPSALATPAATPTPITSRPTNIYVEQKSSGHWTATGYKWQHIEPNHKWNMLLLCGIDYHDVKFWGMNRATFLRLVEEKKITNQGAKGGQSSEGMWFNSGDVYDSLVPLATNEELLLFARTTFC